MAQISQSPSNSKVVKNGSQRLGFARLGGRQLLVRTLKKWDLTLVHNPNPGRCARSNCLYSSVALPALRPKTKVRWLGFWLDSRLKFDAHVKHWASKAGAMAAHLRGLNKTVRGVPPA